MRRKTIKYVRCATYTLMHPKFSFGLESRIRTLSKPWNFFKIRGKTVTDVKSPWWASERCSAVPGGLACGSSRKWWLRGQTHWLFVETSALLGGQSTQRYYRFRGTNWTTTGIVF